MNRIVESVPNFSEGRDTNKVDAIVAVMREVPGVYILGQESDADHNRSVVTLAGEPDAVCEATIRAVGKAAQLIDLTHQTGAHPRIGATDVLPFIPIEGVTIEDCVALAKTAAREIWERFRIPIYLYESAAQRPQCVNLENIRRGQFEGLREEVVRNPDRAPDVGEARLHPTAGATVVGARKFLIAYNVDLATSDISIAKAIAKKIRFSSGGLPCVKAMGVDLRARNAAQVSMNLTDFEKTPIHRAYEEVIREAHTHGVGIAGSEIVGLVPRRALEMTAEHYLKLIQFSPEQILENRLEEALVAATKKPPTLSALAEPFISVVAQPTPAPGGGSVAAIAGALGASLGQMVVGLSQKKKSLESHFNFLAQAAKELVAASAALSAAIDLDSKSYEAVLAAFKSPKNTPDEARLREVAVQNAFMKATEVPLHVAKQAAAVYELLGELEKICPRSMVSDVRVGRMMAATAVRGALENVATNLESITDANFKNRIQADSRSLASRITDASVPASR
jgi:glutamate formiminotransferase / formiminotetrahydrofolate cyclodeaminase